MKKLLFGFILSLSSASFADNFLFSELAISTLMGNLKISSSSMPQVLSQDVTSDQISDFVTMTMAYPDLPSFQVFLRGPRGFLQRTDHSLQVLFLATGFFTGADSTILLGAVPQTVFVGFNYPYGLAAITDDPAKILQTFRVTPGLMALSLKWVSQRGWLNSQKLFAMGVSLGGLFMPTALHIAQEMQVNVSHTIFAFTGSDLKQILANNLRDQVPPDVLKALVVLVPALNILNDPQLHLPFLHGSFLVVYADQDPIIPRTTSEALYSLLPEPKTQVILRGGHIDVDKPLLIEQTKEAILNWLK